MSHADYRKNNDRTQNSSGYHKKDGTSIRAIMNREAKMDFFQFMVDVNRAQATEILKPTPLQFPNYQTGEMEEISGEDWQDPS